MSYYGGQYGYGQRAYGAPPPPPPGGYGAPPPPPPPGGPGGPPGAPPGYGAPASYGGQQYGAPAPQGYGSYGGRAPGAPGAGPGYGGGYAPRAPPAGADPRLWAMFSAVDRDGSGTIGVGELQQALVNGDWSNFDLDTVKMLMTMHDVDRSGQLSFNEFCGLYRYIEQWQGIFRQSDTDRSGTIDANELGTALAKFGFNLPPNLVALLVSKYGSTTRPGGITFDHFVRACVAVKSLTQGFQKYDPQRQGAAQLTYQQFMEIVLQAP